MAVILQSKSKRQRKGEQAAQDLITTSLKRFQITADAEMESRKSGLEDLKFSIGTGQWDAAVKANRELEGKPCLTVNRIPTFLRQLTGEERQHRPAMIVDPVGSGADEETADIIQGIVRHIEVVSNADMVYDNAYDMMLRVGFDYWRVRPEYVSETSFDQEPRIEWVENPFSVYMSPVRKPDGTDPLWCHIIADMSREEYKEKYPNSQMSTLNFPSALGDAAPQWVMRTGVRVAEYWYLELKNRTLCLLPDGKTAFRDELAKDLAEHVEDEREVVTRKVCCVKHNALEILERYEYPGTIIPVIELSGTRLNVDGKIYKAGIVRDARDAQRIYDFMVTREVEQIDLYGKDPLFVAEGSITNHEEEYRQMNRKNFPYLYYKSMGEAGEQLPPPTRAGREPPIQAMAAVAQQADYDLKSVIGIYGTGPGEAGTANESAFAVLTRQQQTDTGTVNWSDNLNRAIRYQGTILLDLFPKLIGQARVQRIINPDDSVKHAIVFNSQLSSDEEAEGLLDGDGLKKIYDLGVGSYDVSLSAGPQYRTARQEAFRAIGVLIAQQPQLFPMLGDIWVKYADWPGAHVLADRLKKLLPPNLQEDTSDPAQKMQMLEAQLQQMGAQHNQLVAELNRASDTIRTKRLDVESRERVSALNNQTQLALQAMKSHDAASLAQLNATIETIQQRLQLLHENMPVEDEAGQPLNSPELPGQVEPHVQPVTPRMPAPRPEPVPMAAPTPAPPLP